MVFAKGSSLTERQTIAMNELHILLSFTKHRGRAAP